MSTSKGKTRPYEFRGGPLDRVRRERAGVPGRWPTYLDERGDVVHTTRIETYRVKDCGCRAYRLYERTPSTDPVLFVWLDVHNHQ